MPSVDDVDFLFLSGQVEPTGFETEDISRAGVDGHAYRRDALRGKPFVMIGKVDCDSLAAAKATYNDCKNLQGYVVSIVDDYGVTTANVMVESVRKLALFPIKTAVGGISTNKLAYLVVEFVMRVTI